MTNAEQILAEDLISLREAASKKPHAMMVHHALILQMLDMLEQQQAQIDVMALEFDRALDIAQKAAKTPTFESAVRIVTEFIEHSSFEQSQQLLAQRDLANKVEALELFKRKFPSMLRKMWSATDINRLVDSQIEQIKNGVNCE